MIIGHRGAKAVAPENTLVSLEEAIRSDADMVEFDVRVTRDGVPVLAHDFRIHGTRKRDLAFIRRYTLSELRKRDPLMTTLDEAMQVCFGRIFMNIEIKELSSVQPTLIVVEQYAVRTDDWDSMLFSSFKPLALRAIRKRAPHAALGMLLDRNPLAFVGWHRMLRFDAIGFHRLHINEIALQIAKSFGLFTYAYTVNRPEAARHLEEKGIDGVVTDNPALLKKKLTN